MTRDEFLEACGLLVGSHHGMLPRVARRFDLALPTLRAVVAGQRPVPAAVASKLEAALNLVDRTGSWFDFIGPRAEGLLAEAVAAGASEREALAALTAWGAIALANLRP